MLDSDKRCSYQPRVHFSYFLCATTKHSGIRPKAKYKNNTDKKLCDLGVIICPASVKTALTVLAWAKSPAEQVSAYPESKQRPAREKSQQYNSSSFTLATSVQPFPMSFHAIEEKRLGITTSGENRDYRKLWQFKDGLPHLHFNT